MIVPKAEKCPCGKDKTYQKCCGEVHMDSQPAICAEDLMRSRYTAFTLGMGQYLNDSHSKSTRNEDEKDSIAQWSKSVKWIKLEVLNSSLGQCEDTKGTVEFKAHFKQGLFKKVIHENSSFIKEEGKWYYVGTI
jgi:SEC-C motif-containing protein